MKFDYENCQSCAMPLNQDPNHGGTNSDGSKSTMYCSYCFQDGKFTLPEMNAEEMKVFVSGKLKEMNVPGFLIDIFTMGIPKLERWKSK